MNGVTIFGVIVIGIVAGWIAEQIMGRRHDIITNLIVGIIGAFVGAFGASMLGVSFAGYWGSLIVATIGAILLLALVNLFRAKR